MKGKRFLSAALSAALLLQLSPLAAFAEDTPLLPDPAPAALTEPAPDSAEEETTPLAEPATETEAEPTATPTQEPTAEPTATPAVETPAPEATVEPTPEPSTEPVPEPSAEPTAEPSPDPAEQVQALIDALPDADAVTEDTADEVEAQLTAIDDAKATLTDEQLTGLDFARYDAAANALLALWGEAPTDEVEMLDNNYTEPQKDSEGYYQISSANDLYWLATTAPKDVKAKLTADITVNSNVLTADGSLNTASSASFKVWTPITDFAGTLDGQGYTISGLYCNTPGSDYVGLFGSINGGTVTHLGVIDSYFAGGSYVGGVCGYSSGTIKGCYSTATVNSNVSSANVLVGYSMGTVENSFAYGHIQGNAGAFGVNGGIMTNCFYLATTTGGTSGNGTTAATADQFKSGAVAYLLGLQDSEWQQNLGENGDAYPRFYPGQTNMHVGTANSGYHNHVNAEECETCKTESGKPAQSGNVYLITNATQLKWFATEVLSHNGSANAKLVNNITVDSWTPIGTQDHPFTGTLDGNGYTVTITSMASNTDNAGLIGYLGSSGKITNIRVAGTVTGGSNVGGVVGYCLGTLQNVINVATVSGTSNVGGVAGYIGSTQSSQNLGNTGTVTGGTPGGVVGTYDSGASLINCYSSTCSLYGTYTKGGFINCYDTVGGQTGITTVDQSAFASGEVAYYLHTRGDGQTWGQSLTNHEAAPNCLNNSPQVFRGTNGEYHNHTSESCNLCSATPPQDANGVYQISTAQQLFGYATLVASANSVFHAKAVLTNDIVVTDTWTPICNYSYDFKGTLDGQGYSITFIGSVGSSQTKYSGLCTGLFAETGNEAVIQNLTVSGNFTAASGYVGAIVGSNSGTINNCRVINSTVSDNGGALVGRNDGTIQNCYSLVQDRPIAGYNASKIINSYRLVGSNTTDTTAATQEQFQSGEIAMKLAAGSTDALKWGQTFGTDAYPTLDGETVFCFEGYYHNHDGGSCPACVGHPSKNASGAYEITSYDNLLWFAKLVNGTLLNGMDGKLNANAVLNTDISVAGNWPGIGTERNAYGGTFSGNGQTVTLTSAGENVKQLFGTTSTDAELNAICVKDGYLTYTDSATVTSCYRPQNAPLFYNKAAGRAANCYTLGNLVEQVDSNAMFKNCFAGTASESGTITGIEVKENTAFTSGEVAYALAKGDTRWGQKLTAPDKNEYPIYNGEPVYCSETAPNKYHNHTGDNCTYCKSEPDTDEDGVYIIRTAANLKWFAKWVNGNDSTVTSEKHPSANAKLGADITLNANVLGSNGEPNSGSFEKWTPIEGFTGTFYGQGYIISGLYFNNGNTDNVGMFKSVYSGGTIQNVNIADSYVCGNDNVGLLCGTNGDENNAGGIISGCTVSGTVEGRLDNIGGVCGRNQGGKVTDCRNTGTVSGNANVGGICGYNGYRTDGNSSKQNGEISNCTTTGNVTGSNFNVGGICGYNDAGTVQECTSNCIVTGTSQNTGGICGQNLSGTVRGCNNTGEIAGINNVGGVCGYSKTDSTAIKAKIENCTNSGKVSGTSSNIGGVCGDNDNSTVQGSNNAGTVAGNSDSVGGVCGNNYNGTVLSSTNTGNVTGYSKNVGGVCGLNSNGTVQSSSNTGIIAGAQYVGGVCGSNAGSMAKCYNTGSVSGEESVGGISGYNSNSIADSYSTGNITGKAEITQVGGICGRSNGEIVRCYSYGHVTGYPFVGGICGVGERSSTFSDCYYLADSEGDSEDDSEDDSEESLLAFGAMWSAMRTNCEFKTDVEFRGGKVAYLLQKAVEDATTEGETPAEIWGQTIGVNQSPVLAWQTDAYQKVYQTSPCKVGYSNTENEQREHHYENGECINCGAKRPVQVAYTVTIPATVELGDRETTATISADGVVLPDGKQLNVKVADDSEFKVTLEGDTSENPDSATYSVKDAKNELVNSGSTVLTVSENTESISTDLTFSAPSSTNYSGKYTGTVTFTVSVDDKTAS